MLTLIERCITMRFTIRNNNVYYGEVKPSTHGYNVYLLVFSGYRCTQLHIRLNLFLKWDNKIGLVTYHHQTKQAMQTLKLWVKLKPQLSHSFSYTHDSSKLLMIIIQGKKNMFHSHVQTYYYPFWTVIVYNCAY